MRAKVAAFRKMKAKRLKEGDRLIVEGRSENGGTEWTAREITKVVKTLQSTEEPFGVKRPAPMTVTMGRSRMKITEDQDVFVAA